MSKIIPLRRRGSEISATIAELAKDEHTIETLVVIVCKKDGSYRFETAGEFSVEQLLGRLAVLERELLRQVR